MMIAFDFDPLPWCGGASYLNQLGLWLWFDLGGSEWT
jgi:hypothetical protein